VRYLTNDKKDTNLKEGDITDTQLSFLSMCKQFGWGTLEVEVKNGQPVMSYEIKRGHKHD